MKSLVLFLAMLIILSPLSFSTSPEKNVRSYEWNFLNQKFRVNFVMGTGNTTLYRDGRFWVIDLYYTSKDYSFYTQYPGGYRIGDNFRYLQYFITPNDTTIVDLAYMLHNISTENDWDTLTEANFLLTFVQNVPYVADYPSTKFMDYYKFPLETLIEGGGDCEDKSILLATLLTILEYDVILFVMQIEYRGVYGHVAVGIHTTYKEGPFSVYLKDYYTYDGKRYYYMESTGEESLYLESGEIRALRYWVGISPEDAGAKITNLSFVPINGSYYEGYRGNSPYVEEITSMATPLALIYVGVFLSLYIPIFVILLRKEKRKCPFCGYILEEDFEYCPNCGYWLDFYRKDKKN